MDLAIVMNQRSAITDTIDAGKMALWFENNIVKIRYGTTTRTLDIGITLEEVQDLLNNSFQDTASIKWVYDDSANAFFANVDSNILNTVNSALQGGANISLLTNNLGFETPLQLNARDLSNRDRSNHTGQQLSSTISNFSESVRSTILTGISFLNATAVSATDSILVAIGKLQAQLNAKVFGNNFEFYTSPSSFTTNSSSFVTAYSYTTQSLPVGKYRVGYKFNFTSNSQSSSATFRGLQDGVTFFRDLQVELKDSTDDITYTPWGYFDVTSQGAKTLELQVVTEGSMTTSIANFELEIWRVS